MGFGIGHKGHSAYLRRVFAPIRLKEVVTAVAKKVESLRHKRADLEFDAIAFTGNSGAGVAYPVGYLTGLKLICVRKERNSHGRIVESAEDTHNYIIIDDFIASGSTICNIISTLRSNGYGKCVGIILYHHKKLSRSEFDGIPVYSAWSPW